MDQSGERRRSNEEGNKRKAEGEEDDSMVKETVKYHKMLQRLEARNGSSATQEAAEVAEVEVNEEDEIGGAADGWQPLQ